MDRLTLPGIGIEVSRLGFGCTAIMGCMSHVRSVRVLHAAFDAGVTHSATAASDTGLGRGPVSLRQVESMRAVQAVPDRWPVNAAAFLLLVHRRECSHQELGKCA